MNFLPLEGVPLVKGEDSHTWLKSLMKISRDWMNGHGGEYELGAGVSVRQWPAAAAATAATTTICAHPLLQRPCCRPPLLCCTPVAGMNFALFCFQCGLHLFTSPSEYPDVHGAVSMHHNNISRLSGLPAPPPPLFPTLHIEVPNNPQGLA